MKKLLIAIMMLLPMMANAYDFEQDGVYYNIISNQDPFKVEVTSGLNPYSGSLSIGKTLIHDGKTYAITRIGDNAFAGCSSLSSITLSEGLESLGVGSFSGCITLSAISIPSTVTTIDTRSFSACSQLSSISLPSSLANLGDYCFSGCIALTSISIPSQVVQLGDYCFSGCTKISSLSLPSSVTQIGQYCFNDCIALEFLQLSSSLISLPSFFISGCKQLKSIIIPSSVETLGESCFGNSFLESLTIPNTVTYVNGKFLDKNPNIKRIVYNANTASIPTYYENNQRIQVGCFNECLALESIEIKSPVKILPAYCFKECIALKSLLVPDGLISIGGCCFVDCYALTDFSIPETVRSIGGACFYYCKSLKSIDIPYGVTELPSSDVYYYGWDNGSKNGSYLGGGGCFWGCESLESVTIPSSVVSMGYASFSGCSSLKSINLPSTITSLDRRFFNGCKSLSSIIIPSSVTSIGNECFCGCESLSEMTIPSSVTSLGESCFRGCGLSTITIPSTITELKKYTFGSCPNLKTIIIPSSITRIEEGCFSSCTSLESFSIPNSVSIIGGACFAMCTALKNIQLPESITELMDGSYSSGTYSTTWSTGFFGGCSSLTEIELPSSIIKVGNGCFSDCSNLSKLTINAENVPETGYSVFEGTLYKSVGSLFVPENSAALYKAAEQWKDWKNISEGKGYKLTYLVDGLEYKFYYLEYGEIITPEAEPTKETYKFSGWSEIPETMPAHDVVVTGTFERYFDVGNLTKAVDFVMNNSASAEDVALYDLNNNKKLDIGDVILIVKFILNNNSNNAPNYIGRRAGEIADLAQYTAAQFEVKTTGDVDIRLVKSMEQTHQMMYQQKDANTYAVVVYSLTNQLMQPENGKIIETDNISDILSIENVTVATPTGETAYYQTLSTTTGIEQIGDENGTVVVYDLKGNRLNSGKALNKGIYIVNGKKAVVR